MAYDHISVNIKDDVVEFDEGSLTEVWQKDFYIYGTTVYVGMEVKAVSGTIEVKWTVTDSVGGTDSSNNTTAVTSWTNWTDDDQFEIDVSSLTTGEGTIGWEVNGDGQARNIYIVIYST